MNKRFTRRGTLAPWVLGNALLYGALGCSGDDAPRNEPSFPRARQAAGADDPLDASVLPHFSFFVTSLRAMVELSGSQAGFGGDLRFGEIGGDNPGLRGADKICTAIAEQSMPGAGTKVWRAFLSTVKGGPRGGPVHAIDRVGDGPWYDRVGRLVAETKADLVGFRPRGADPQIRNDLPNEDGVPNRNPDGTGEVDNHDTLTGSNDKGQVYRLDPRVTCNDWTKSERDPGDAPRVGHSWPRTLGRPNPDGGRSGNPFGGFDPSATDGGARPPFPGFPGLPGFPGFPGLVDGGILLPPGLIPPGLLPPGLLGDAGIWIPPGLIPPWLLPPGLLGRDGGNPGGFSFPFGGDGGFPFGGGGMDYGHWISSLDEAGCGAGVSIVEMGPPWETNPTVGSGGGYGGIYCFALTP